MYIGIFMHCVRVCAKESAYVCVHAQSACTLCARMYVFVHSVCVHNVCMCTVCICALCVCERERERESVYVCVCTLCVCVCVLCENVCVYRVCVSVCTVFVYTCICMLVCVSTLRERKAWNLVTNRISFTANVLVFHLILLMIFYWLIHLGFRLRGWKETTARYVTIYNKHLWK